MGCNPVTMGGPALALILILMTIHQFGGKLLMFGSNLGSRRI